MSIKNEEYYKIYSQELIKKYEKSLTGVMETIFFSTNNTILYEEIISSFLKLPNVKEKNPVIINDSITIETSIEPFFPFLKNIEQLLRENKINIDKLLKKCAYHTHIPVLRGFLEKKEYKRSDSILIEEIDYELFELFNSIIAMLNYVSANKSIIMIINGIEKLEETTLKLIISIIESAHKGKIFFIFCFNESHRVFKDIEKSIWNSFLENIVREKIYHIEFSDSDLILPEKIIYTKDIIEKELLLSRLKFNFLCYDELKLKLAEIYNIVIFKKIPLENEKIIELLKMLSDVFLFRNDPDGAINNYNILLDYLIEGRNKRDIAYTYCRLAACYREKTNFEVCERFLNKAIKISNELQDKELMLLSNFLHFHNVEYGRFFNQNIFFEKFQNVMSLAKELNDGTIYFKSYAILITDNAVNLDTKKRMEYCNAAIEEAEKRKNKLRLGALYHIKGIIFSVLNDKENQFACYRKSIRLKSKYSNKNELAYILNGTGFGYFKSGEYREALEYYRKALKCLRTTKSYEEITLTLYNIAESYFFALNYKNAIYFLESVFSFMRILNLGDIIFHSIFGVYAFAGIAYLKNGNVVKAYECKDVLKKMNRSEKGEEIFYYHFFHAMLLFREERIEEALLYMKNIEENFSFDSTLMIYFFYEYGLRVKRYEMFEKAEELFIRGLNLSEKMGYRYYKERFEYELKLREKYQKNELTLFKYDVEDVLEAARQESVLNKLHKKIDEVNFLNTIQKRLIEHNTTIEEMLTGICEMINDVFFVEITILSLKKDNENQIIYEKFEKSKNRELYQFLNHMAEENKEIYIKTFFDSSDYFKDNIELNSIINIPLMVENENIGNLFLATKDKDLFFNEDDFRIISMAARQISVAVINRKLKEEIEEKNIELTETIEKLKLAQNQLIESEKMASLGGLVAGVAHELNTPVGVSITASSYIDNAVSTLIENYESGKMRKKDFEYHMSKIQESGRIITNNLGRAGELINSFKKVAIDQTIDERRKFNIKKYIYEIITSLKPKLKKVKHQLIFECEDEIVINSYPGTFYQILNNFIENSLLHAFNTKEGGIMKIKIEKRDDKVFFEYSDNGNGMGDEVKDKIFEPFFTTKRNRGGTGLGMSIVYNLVVQHLKGKIDVESELGKGSRFIIEFDV